MIAVRFGAAALACAAACALATAEEKKLENKLPAAVVTALERAEELEVYSLDGEDSDGWHGAKLLGKTTVKDAKSREALAAALVKGVGEGEKGARCFIPRHGVHAAYAGKTYDLVICFECGWAYVYTDNSDKPNVLMISESPQKPLNKVLTDAKVKLAKPAK